MRDLGSKTGSCSIPDHALETLADCFLPAIRAYFDTPEGQAEFAAWEKEQDENDNIN